MKKLLIILSLIALALAPALRATPVSSDRALHVARLVFNAQPATKASSGALRIVWDGEFATTKAAVQPAFYVVARDGGGFVIIAGDDNVRPVLAISENGKISSEDMPDNVRWWMEGLKRYVRSKKTQTPEIRALWDSYVATKTSVITGEVKDKMERLTPEWDQGNTDWFYFGYQVFNSQCPLQDGELTVTGCTATALGELLTYMSGLEGVVMPSSGKGIVGGYEVSEGFVAPEPYELTAVYEWATLRTLTDTEAIKSASEEARLNLGRLIADIGAILHAEYSISLTKVSSNVIPLSMGEHFYMNKGAHFRRANQYLPRQWVSMLKDELDKSPVMYHGYTDDFSSGHSFVLDGYGTYDGAEVFHFNFGWSGYYNGYYFPFDLDFDDFELSFNCGALFDFYPDFDGGGSCKPKMMLEYSPFSPPGLTLASGSTIRSGEEFKIVFGKYVNEGYAVFQGSSCFFLVDKDGGFKASIGRIKLPALEVNYFYDQLTMTCLIPADVPLAFGDKIILVTCNDPDAAEPVYEPVPFDINGLIVAELPVMPAAFIDAGRRYAVGDDFVFRLLNNDYPYAASEWLITDPDGIITTYKQSEGSALLNKAGRYEIEARTRTAENEPFRETIVCQIRVGDRKN